MLSRRFGIKTMAELDWITVEGFRSIATIEKQRLGPVNILIGANGSGKSNFIEAFSFLQAIRSAGLRRYVGKEGGADRVLHFGVRTTSSMKLHVSFQDEANQYEINLAADDGDGLFPSEERAYFWNKRYPRPYELLGRDGEAGISDPDRGGISRYVRGHLGRWRRYHFHDTGRASPMKKTADVNDNRFLRADGSNLAAFLYLLRETHEESYRLIRRAVRLVAPFFDDFMLEPTALNPDKIRLEWKHRGTDAYFDASSLSDGSLRFIALATLMLQPKSLRPSVILMDEPELGLHPYAVTILASLVKQASVDAQIIFATQSSLLLDHFSPEDVLVAERVSGRTELSRLEFEELKEWLTDYSLGQLWEKNQFGGRPSAEGTDQAG